MTAAGHDADERMRMVMAAMPELMRADRPRSASLRRITDLARCFLRTRYATAALIGENGFLGPVAVSWDTSDGVGPLPSPLEGRGAFEELLRSPSTLRVNDMSAAPPGLSLPAGHPPVQSFLGARLRSGNQPVGILSVADRLDGLPFDDDDEELAAALGEMLGSALGNAHLLRDSLRARQWARAATGMTRELFSGNLEESLRLISERARELAAAEIVTVLLVEGDEAVVRYAGGSRPARQLVGHSVPLDRTLVLGNCLKSGRAEIVPDISTIGGTTVRQLVGVDLGPTLLLPLHGSSSVVGVLSLSRRVGAPGFTETDLETAESFANHVAVTLELASARATEEKLRLVEDRNRIARDLHDHVVQRLFATGLSLQQALPHLDGKVHERVESGVATLDETIRQIRNTILTLRAEDQTTTLETFVGAITREATPLLGFAPVVALETPSGEVSGALASDLGACVREGLSNVVRHAKASAVEVRANFEPGYLVLTLRDDGVGIQSSRRSGLDNLATRVGQHGGTFEVTCPPEGGTLLTWRVPLSAVD